MLDRKPRRGGGENFQEAIVRAIRAAKIMILVFTNNANNSAEIKKELALASQYKLIVIPARVEDVMPAEALAYELATRQWINLFADWENEIQNLSTRLRGLLSAQTGDQSETLSKTTRSEFGSVGTIAEPEQHPRTGTSSSPTKIFPPFAMALLAISGPVFTVVLLTTAPLANLNNTSGLIIVAITVATATFGLVAGYLGYANKAANIVLTSCASSILVSVLWFFAVLNGEPGSATIPVAISTIVYIGVCLLTLFYFFVARRVAKLAN